MPNEPDPNAAPTQPPPVPPTVPQIPSDVPEWARGEGWTTELQGLAASKKWGSPLDAAIAYQAAGKIIGVPPDELVRIPKNAALEDLLPALRKLGAGEKPEDYEFGDLATPEGSPDVLGWFKGAAAKYGIPKTIAAELAKEYDGWSRGAADSAGAGMVAARKVAGEVLRAEWGPKYDENISHALGALETLGIDPDLEPVLELAVGGPEKFARLLAGLGAKLADFKVTAGKGGAGSYGPEAAMAKISELRSDPAFLDGRHPRHKAVVEEIDKLSEQVHGTAPALGGGGQGFAE